MIRHADDLDVFWVQAETLIHSFVFYVAEIDWSEVLELDDFGTYIAFCVHVLCCHASSGRTLPGDLLKERKLSGGFSFALLVDRLSSHVQCFLGLATHRWLFELLSDQEVKCFAHIIVL